MMAGIDLNVVGTYFAPTGATTEIAAHDPATQRVFYTSATSNALGIVSIANPAAPAEVALVDLTPYGGGPNSVAVKNGLVAVAVEAVDKTSPGQVLFFDTNGVLQRQIAVGALPDMLTFTPDGRKLLVANEGEPNSYGQVGSVDPEGSVSIIDLSSGLAAATVATADFTSYNSAQAALVAAGVRIFGPGATVAQDLEPEYIALSPDGATAYVTLQENNALAVVDVATATVTSIEPLGYKDHATTGNGLDASDRDVPGSSNAGVINIRNWPVLGMYQPDAIASFQVGGQTYLLTANEGDARDYVGFAEEGRVGALTLDATAFASQGFADVSTGLNGLRNNDNLGRLNVTRTLGNPDADADYESLYAFGARSFSIWNTAGDLVYDSGDDLEQITAAALPNSFNAGHDDATFDSRSDNKGPEPEAAMIAKIGARTLAFVGLERIGGIAVYDVSNPLAPVFERYVNHRDFSQPTSSDAALDLGVEDLKYIGADESPTGLPLIMSVNEISGTLSFFALSMPSGARLTPDGVLEIVGTAADDAVHVGRAGANVRVTAGFLPSGSAVFPAAQVQSIHALMGAGNDRVFLDRHLTIPAVLEGWAGADQLSAGGGLSTMLGGLGNDILLNTIGTAIMVGGEGNDLLSGLGGRSIAIGGRGMDALVGGHRQDLLIGGSTAFDTDLVALQSLGASWFGPGSFAARKSALESGVASPRGQLRLARGVTYFDDSTVDVLLGGGDFDWLLGFPGDALLE